MIKHFNFLTCIFLVSNLETLSILTHQGAVLHQKLYINHWSAILSYYIYLISKTDLQNWIKTWIITVTFVRKLLCSELFVFKTDTQAMSPVVNIVVILVNQTKKISRDFTRFAIISQPKVQITQNKNPVEANNIAYHIIVNFYKTDIQLSQKKMFL